MRDVKYEGKVSMGSIVRLVDGEKARSKINACRESGLLIQDNFISDVTKALDGDCLVLSCTRLSKGGWKLEFNTDYWEEIAEPVVEA